MWRKVRLWETWDGEERRGKQIKKGNYVVAGVTVTNMKLEQSAFLDERGGFAGTFAVPVTALAQLSALHPAATMPTRPRRRKITNCMIAVVV
jgi:hypothetical protein